MSKLDGPKIPSGIACISFGISSAAVGAGVVPAEVNGPQWLMSLVGLLFFLVGVVLIRGKPLERGSYIASIMLLCFSLIALGLGFLSGSSLATNVIFGSSSLCCLFYSIYALKTKGEKER